MSRWLAIFYQNNVLANLFFVLILSMGVLSYRHMPREQDPNINFNWIQITTIYPGAAAEDVEKLVTDRLEEAIRKLSDVKFVSSNSRESISSILVRFNDLTPDVFDKRVNDLRREIQNKEDELPEETKTPQILEITTANAFPTATLVVTGQANDETLRKQTKLIKEDLEQFEGVDRVEAFGLHAPELQIVFDPDILINHGINAIDVVQTLQVHFNDLSAGTSNVGSEQWLIRWLGKEDSPDGVAKFPILGAQEELLLGEIAKVQRGREKAARLVNYSGKPAIMLSVMKKAQTNTLELVESVHQYINDKNITANATGTEVILLDDQTQVTRNALNVMQNNAFVGLFLVLLATWLFLGFRIAFLVSIGIPFTLSGTFWVLDMMGNTLNVSVLLGTVITLGMLVDDSVVVVEAIYFRLTRGVEKMTAILSALREVFAPVTTSILTTAAAFVPLMLLPGILGKFMMVIPMVVTMALLISLVEAYWMLPAHIQDSRLQFTKPSPLHKWRTKITHLLRIRYTRYLIKVMRQPKKMFLVLSGLFSIAIIAISLGLIRVNFFANDPLRIFYVNVEMPPGTSLDNTLKQARAIEEKVRAHLTPQETRSVNAYAGLMFSEVEPLFGDQYGQISVSLAPQVKKMRHVDQIIEDMRKDILNTAGPLNISFLRLAGGPPTSKPINIKVRGTDYTEIRQAVDAVKSILKKYPTIYDINDDDSVGRRELLLRPNLDAIHRAGLKASDIARIVRLLTDGELITDFQHEGEKVEVRVQAQPKNYSGIRDILQQTISFHGREIRLSELVTPTSQPSMNNIRHYNFRRTITILAELDKEKSDTLSINQAIQKHWKEELAQKFPGVDLNFSGELDDIQESLDALPRLFLFGIGLIYLILGTQFKSYWQPLMILTTIPLAFTGVTFGLLITQNPLSLYTLYGIVALSGISVNTSIVLISAANQRLQAGMSEVQATLYAARRRLIPVLITSLTTIAGLFSLATGLGGKSLLWGPVATSIVWGLLFSTVLTLLVIPMLYHLCMRHPLHIHIIPLVTKYLKGTGAH